VNLATTLRRIANEIEISSTPKTAGRLSGNVAKEGLRFMLAMLEALDRGNAVPDWSDVSIVKQVQYVLVSSLMDLCSDVTMQSQGHSSNQYARNWARILSRPPEISPQTAQIFYDTKDAQRYTLSRKALQVYASQKGLDLPNAKSLTR